jgi:serine/threonine-protein kinase
MLVVVLAATLVAAAILALRNVRAGRGDRRGALRLSTFVFAVMFVSWFFGESHVATLWEVALVVMAMSWALFAAASSGLAYLAAEPFLRRRWPEVLVTWARVVAGEWRDPLVGRDVLVGCAAGAWAAAIVFVGLLSPEWVGARPELAAVDVLGFPYGVKAVMPLLVWRWAYGIMAALACLFMLLVLRLLVHSQHVATAVFVIGGAAITSAGAAEFWIVFLTALVSTGVFALLLVRFGLLAAVIQFYVFGLFVFFPVTGDLATWYAGASVTAIVVLAALTIFGFTTSLGGRPALGRAAIAE